MNPNDNLPHTDVILNERTQIQYLMGNPPSWMMHYGISAIAIFFLVILCLGYLIRYPDVLETSIVLTTANPPIRIMAQTGGRISALLVQDHQMVQKNEVLGVLENTANWQDVLLLEQWLQQPTDSLLSQLQLGPIQQAYSDYSQHWKEFEYIHNNDHTSVRIKSIEQQITQLKYLNLNLYQQKELITTEFALNTKEKTRQEKLLQQGLIADQAFEKTAAEWLQQKRQITSAEAQILQNQLQIKQLQNQVKNLQLQDTEGEHDKSLVLAEDLSRLKSVIESWKQAYLIIAPIDGSISLSNIWSAQQNVQTGQEILAVVPKTNTNASFNIIGKAILPAESIDKISPQTQVIVRLDGWPAQQYGTLGGQISNLAALPQEKGYTMDIAFPNVLISSYHKQIPFRQEMSGQVKIILEDRRVLERLFDHLRDLIKNT